MTEHMGASLPADQGVQRRRRVALVWRRSIGRLRSRRAERLFRGYLMALLGVALATALIAVAQIETRIGNSSVLYLLVVLWIAIRYGRWPAVCAAFLSFLAYDLFFIPPLFHLTVSDPAQWLALLALLATALVLGQLTATVQARAQEARESRQRAETLYALAQLIATATDESALFVALAEQVTQVFAPAGVIGSALLLPDEQGTPTARASAFTVGAIAGHFDGSRSNAAAQSRWAERALQDGAVHGGILSLADAGSGQLHVTFFAPLNLGRQGACLLGIVGSAACLRLAMRPGQRVIVEGQAGVVGASEANQGSVLATSEDQPDPQADLFAAFCDQIALAVERMALRRQAIHAEALRESDSLKSALLGSVTHDLRTPLAAMKAAATSLLNPAAPLGATETQELAGAINESVDRLNRLVGNLLDLSRLEAGVAQPHLQWYLFEDVVGAACDLLERAGQLHDHRIAVDLPPDLPPLRLDHEQIEQVMVNLLDNAIKYSPGGSVVTVTARVVERQDGEEFEARVRDEGIGIAPGELTAIFDKFYRVQRAPLPWSPDRPTIGTGLGLAICASILAAHGGRIWAESAPGAGATFIITLPIASERPRGELPEATPAHLADAQPIGPQPVRAQQ